MKQASARFKWEAEVTRVVDGDTVDADIDLGFDLRTKKRVRLWGINAPESRTRDKEEKVRGLAAKDRLKELVEGKMVTLESHALGKYGRVLGVLYVGDLDINRALVEECHAVEYHGGKR